MDRAKPRLCLLHSPLDRCRIGHIHRCNQYRYIGHVCAQVFGLGLQLILRSATQREPATRLRQRQRNGGAYARTRTSDEGMT